jgi:hypothetical protein
MTFSLEWDDEAQTILLCSPGDKWNFTDINDIEEYALKLCQQVSHKVGLIVRCDIAKVNMSSLITTSSDIGIETEGDRKVIRGDFGFSLPIHKNQQPNAIAIIVYTIESSGESSLVEMLLEMVSKLHEAAPEYASRKVEFAPSVDDARTIISAYLTEQDLS